MLHNLDIAHQMGTVLRCWPRDGSGSVGRTRQSVSGADLCRLQVRFWGQGKRDPITVTGQHSGMTSEGYKCNRRQRR